MGLAEAREVLGRTVEGQESGGATALKFWGNANAPTGREISKRKGHQTEGATGGGRCGVVFMKTAENTTERRSHERVPHSKN